MNTGTIKNVLHSKKFDVSVVEQHIETRPIPLIKIMHDDKSDRDIVKNKIL